MMAKIKLLNIFNLIYLYIKIILNNNIFQIMKRLSRKKKTKKKPFFSIITVVKNDEKNISRTIESIQNQNFKNFEHIVIDGKSNDNTLRKVLSYRNIDIVISEKDNGIYYAMNKGLKNSKGEVILFVNSGDLITKNALNIVYKKFISRKIDFVFGTVRRHYIKNTILKYGYNFKKLYYNFDFATSHSTGFFLKKKFYNLVNNFDTKYKCSADYDVYYKLFIEKKLNGSFTDKNQLIGIVSSGGFSSKYGFFNSLLEECKIRLNNGQNFFIVLIILFNSLIKKFLKATFNIYNAKEINQKNT